MEVMKKWECLECHEVFEGRSGPHKCGRCGSKALVEGIPPPASPRGAKANKRQRKTQGWKYGKAKEMRRAPTSAEYRLWIVLRRRRMLGLKFHRQTPKYGYICDFYCPEAKICIEVDGGYHRTENDAIRDANLAKHGIQTLRFTNEEVLQDHFRVGDEICQHLVQAGFGPETSRPNPPHPIP